MGEAHLDPALHPGQYQRPSALDADLSKARTVLQGKLHGGVSSGVQLGGTMEFLVRTISDLVNPSDAQEKIEPPSSCSISRNTKQPPIVVGVSFYFYYIQNKRNRSILAHADTPLPLAVLCSKYAEDLGSSSLSILTNPSVMSLINCRDYKIVVYSTFWTMYISWAVSIVKISSSVDIQPGTNCIQSTEDEILTYESALFKKWSRL